MNKLFSIIRVPPKTPFFFVCHSERSEESPLPNQKETLRFAQGDSGGGFPEVPIRQRDPLPIRWQAGRLPYKRMIERVIFGHILMFLICLPGLLQAVRTEKWSNDSFSEFSEGEARGVAITSDGFLKVGPETRKIASLSAEVIWAVVRDPRPSVKGDRSEGPVSKSPLYYVAAGNEGQVFKVGGDGKPVEFFKCKELQVSALAVDSSGNLYAGSMPDGKVYRIEPKGSSSVFFEPKEKYIWALQFDGEGNLFVATGDKGRLYKVNRSGKGTVFYDSDETHLRSLLLLGENHPPVQMGAGSGKGVDGKQRLWVGSDGNGLVYRFDKIDGPQAVPFVAYDSGFREIKALAAAPDGSVFVGAMGDGKASSLPFSVQGSKKSTDVTTAIAAIISSAQKGSDAGKEAPKAEEVSPSSAEDEKAGAGEIIRILPDGSVERWWTGNEDVFSLMVPETGGRGVILWAGTGKKGKLIELTGPRRFSILGQLEARSITALLPDGRQGCLAATSNSGALWSVALTPGRKGTFESKVFDTRGSSTWGALQTTLVPGSGKVALSTRSGNTAKPDKVWSDWIPLDNNSRVQSPTGRFIQYKVTLESAQKSDGVALAVDSAALFYQPRNRPPQVTRVTILQSNIELAKVAKAENPLPPIMPGLGMPSGSRSYRGGNPDGADESFIAFGAAPMIQQVKKLGWRSAMWQAHDVDGDDLRYETFYRTAGSDAWKPLKKDLNDPFVSWDAATWPDGDYYLKVIATDLPGNREKEARSDEQSSDLFTVDNTAPTIQADVTPQTIKKGFVAFTISDTTSIVDEAEISVDGGDWRPFLPVSGLYDSKSNEFRLPIDQLKPGDHYVVIRASDSANNVASQTIKFHK